MVTDPAITAFFAAHPTFSAVVLGHGANAAALDLRPLGVEARFVDAAANPALVAHYLAANQAKFGGPLALPGWVLVDLYLLPGAITLIVDDAPISSFAGENPIVAAWCGVPTVTPGVVMGVSLLALREGLGAAWAVKRLGLSVLRAQVQRGLTQWNNRSLRAHTRLGPLRVVGPAPAAHGAAVSSFVYEIDLFGEPLSRVTTRLVEPSEGPAIAARAASGEQFFLVAPGLDEEGHVVIAEPAGDDGVGRRRR